jgi:transcription-repair coupling factor (superfamily II helicase)
VIAFRRNTFANPAGLIDTIQRSGGRMRVQPDQKVVFKAEWDQPEERLAGVRALVHSLGELAAKVRKAAA